METFIAVLQSKTVRSDKKAIVINTTDIEKAFRTAKIFVKNIYPNYKIKSISES